MSIAKRQKKMTRAPPPAFMALEIQLVVFVRAFVMVSTLWSVYCLPQGALRAQPFAKADWAAWQPDTCQVGPLVRSPGGPPRQMLK